MKLGIGTGSVVDEAMGGRRLWGRRDPPDTFADAGRRLVAKVRRAGPTGNTSPKMTWPEARSLQRLGTLTWPRAVAPVRRRQVTRTIVPAGKRTDGAGRVYRLPGFPVRRGLVCGVMSASAPSCIAAQGRKGRRVLIHPQEGMLLNRPGPVQQSADYDESSSIDGW